MPFFVIPAHNHTDPSGSKSLVKEAKIYLPPEHEWDPFFKLTPVVGLVYAVYLAYRACMADKSIRLLPDPLCSKWGV